MRTKLFILILFSTLVISCSNKENNLVSLDGTVWTSTYEGGNVVLKFTNDEFTIVGTFVNEDGSKREDKTQGIYKYEPPLIVMKALNIQTGDVETHHGAIKDDILTLDKIVFKKQK